jgi:hypothetical protein
MKRMSLSFVLGVALSACFGGMGLAQQSPVDRYITLLRTDLVTEKASVIVSNMELSEQEMNAFWPVYNAYQKDLSKVGDAKVAVIKDYVAHIENIDDAKARELTKKAVEVEEHRLGVIKKYIGKFSKVLPAKQVARFFQLELQMQRMIDLQVAAELPLLK